jgi:hypothetical protein
MLNEQTPYFAPEVWEVTILGVPFRFQVPQRSRAVTLALKEFVERNPEVDLSLSILRSKVRTRSISAEELLMERAANG